MSKKSKNATKVKSVDSSKTKSTASGKESTKSAESVKDSKDSDKASSESSTSDSDKASTSKSEKGKSQKETVSSSDVHYGYFSSVRTPAYRKGWDEIFGGKKNSRGPKATNNGDRLPPSRKKKAAIKQPLKLELDIGELPDQLQVALNNEIKRRIKRRRINFEKHNAAGAVRWKLICEIDH